MWETIYKQLRLAGDVKPKDYAKVIEDLTRLLGYDGAPERPHDKVPARFLVEKVERVCELGSSDARARQVGAILSQRLNI